MNKISKRQFEIIREIETNNPITGKGLSAHLNVSLRTIQYEIKEINKQFNIIQSSRNGYSLNSNYYGQSFLIEDNYDDVFSILIQLLISENKIIIENLSDEHFLSDSSLNRKLDIIKNILSNSNLFLRKSRGYLWIDGLEINKRKFISYLLTKEADFDFGNSISHYEKYLKGIDIDYIRSITLNTIHSHGYQINVNYTDSLLANIYITLYRSKINTDDFQITQLKSVKKTVEYLIAKDICDQYSCNWKYQMNENNIYYLATILQGQLVSLAPNKAKKNNKTMDNEAFVQEINVIVKETFNYYKIDMPTKNFIYNFSLHVADLIQRSMNNNNTRNDLLENLKRNCPFIYDVSVTIARKISIKYNVTISDEEIGFIAIHVGAQIESNSSYKNKINILLLTSKYQNISDNIKNKLLEQHDSSIVIFEKLDDIETNHIDLIITNKSQNILGKKMITVSPFFNEKDQRIVNHAIAQCISKKESDFQDIMMNTFFKEKLFFREKNSFTKEQAIEFLCSELVKQKVVNDDFINSVLERENSSSTCFFESFAIPHAFEFLGKKSRFAVLISEEGILWDNHKIHLVLLMSIKLSDRRIFMSTYNTIIRVLQNKTKIKELVDCTSLNEFIHIICNKK